jgi:UTP-glucose-1-phosphate uridylyltransferase
MNKKKLTLVILAAGMGSRYGGLKQMDSFTNNGDTIIDFSIYDAIQAGFNKIVFVIRKSFEVEFKKAFDKKLLGKVEVIYVFQELNNIPSKYINPKRIKPWGTGNALLSAQNVIDENFAIINADDFYGRKAYEIMAEKLQNTDKLNYDFSMVGYPLKNTISENGYVSRGECTVNENGFLTDVTERVRIEKIDGVLKTVNVNNEILTIDENTIVSMNFWGFTPKIFEFGNQLFLKFLEVHHESLTAEFYLPTIVNKIINTESSSLKVLKSDSKWFGVTYSADKEKVENEIKELINLKVYPNNLWN